jgi:hypothetical protein
MTQFDNGSLTALFVSPANDGKFPRNVQATLTRLGQRRPVVLLAFPPKSAGTYLRTAICDAVNGQLVRVGHAQGGRDTTPYLPTFLHYYSGGVCTGPMVGHAHMQALAANRHFLEAFDIKPVIMLRSIPDMLASYWDMLETDAQARQDGLNCLIPENFAEMTAAAKADFMIDVLGPWYASFFATWLRYAEERPGRVCVLTYNEFKSDPAATMERALAHARLPRTRAQCAQSLDRAWATRSSLRFNKGEAGRGSRYFAPGQRNRLARMLGHYKQLASMMDVLLAASGEDEALRQVV